MFCFGVHSLYVVLVGFNLSIVGFVKTLHAYFLLCKYISLNKGYLGHAVAQLVEVLRYKPEGRGFDSLEIFH
jgi:hypothetical protein